jgi:O-antigen/teichoic acid export membrane protein
VQSVAKVVDLYPTVVLSWLTMHLFPLMSASINDKKLIVAHLERTVNIAVALIVPIIDFIFILRIPILQILYKHDFVVAEHYFAAMLLLGIPKVLTWVIGVPLLPLGMKKIWFWTSLLFSAVYGMIVFIFDPFGVGIFIIPIASFTAFLIQYAALLLMYRSNGYRFTREFGIQNILYGLMILSFLLAVVEWEWSIAAVCLIYGYTLVKYNLWNDIKQRILQYAKKES